MVVAAGWTWLIMIVVIIPTLKAEMILLGATSSVESYCLQMNARYTISEKKFVFLWYDLYIKIFHVLKNLESAPYPRSSMSM